ncbi:MAG: hemin uptake protein HemP [Thiobacillus sp.]
MDTQMPSSPASPSKSGQSTLQPGIVEADVLFRGHYEIVISHNGAHYRLRITKNGKLILTK